MGLRLLLLMQQVAGGRCGTAAGSQVAACDGARPRPLEEFHRRRRPWIDLDHPQTSVCIDDQIDAQQTDGPKPLRQQEAEPIERRHQTIAVRKESVGVKRYGTAPRKRARVAPRLADQLSAHAKEPRTVRGEAVRRRQGRSGHESLPDAARVCRCRVVDAFFRRHRRRPPPDTAAAGAGQRLDEPCAVERETVRRGSRLGKLQASGDGGGGNGHGIAEPSDALRGVAGERSNAGDGIDEVGMVFDRAGVAPHRVGRKARGRCEKTPRISRRIAVGLVRHGHRRLRDRLQVEVAEQIRGIHLPAGAGCRRRQGSDRCSEYDEVTGRTAVCRSSIGFRATHDGHVVALPAMGCGVCLKDSA